MPSAATRPERVTGIDEHRRRRRAELARVFGGVIGEALADPSIIEIMVNEDGAVFVDRLLEGMHDTGARMAPIDVEDAIVTAASEMGTVVDAEHPTLSGELPLDGSRVQAFLPPVTTGPALIIRKHRRQGEDGVAALTVGDFRGAEVPHDNATASDYPLRDLTVPELFRHTIRERWNVIISGPAQSGKTAFGGAFLAEISAQCPDDRIVTIEDTRELRCSSRNKLMLKQAPQRCAGLLLKDALRARPDRIIFGEVRDGAAHDLLMSWNTGHNGGFCTIHANDPLDSLYRLEDLVAQAGVAVVPRAIARAVDLIVTIRKARDGRRAIVDLVRVNDALIDGQYDLHPLEPRWS